MKLGLDAATPSPLTDYAAKNRPFPHHSTTRQWFTQPRSEAYVALGRYAATCCLNDLDGTFTASSATASRISLPG